VPGLPGFAFVAAPHACEWGLGAYFLFGLAVDVALGVLAFVHGRGRAVWQRLLMAVAAIIFGVALWTAGLFVADMRIICRLF
jgi:hypothetical protein